MEVILKQDVQGVGYANDIVDVAPGYGRNYLIPAGYAVFASESNKKQAQENLRQAAHKIELIRKEAEETATKLSQITLEIETKTGITGKIFGAITAAQIAAALKAKGFEIDRRKILLTDPPKEVGLYEVAIDLHKEVKPSVKLNIVGSQDQGSA